MDEKALRAHGVRAKNSRAKHFDDTITVWDFGSDENGEVVEFYLKPIHCLYILIGAIVLFLAGFLTNYFWLISS